MQQQRGFTLIELIVTLTVAGILTALAVPSFKTTIQNNRLVTQSNDLLSSLLYARSQAIGGGATQQSSSGKNWSVEVCASSNADTCNSSNWANGWVVIGYTSAPTGAAGTVTNIAPSASTLLHAYPALPSGTSLNGTPFGSVITFASNGTVNSTITGSNYFILCDSRGVTYARAIYLGSSGEARVSTSAGKYLNGNSITGC